MLAPPKRKLGESRPRHWRATLSALGWSRKDIRMLAREAQMLESFGFSGREWVQRFVSHAMAYFGLVTRGELVGALVAALDTLLPEVSGEKIRLGGGC